MCRTPDDSTSTHPPSPRTQSSLCRGCLGSSHDHYGLWYPRRQSPQAYPCPTRHPSSKFPQSNSTRPGFPIDLPVQVHRNRSSSRVLPFRVDRFDHDLDQVRYTPLEATPRHPSDTHPHRSGDQGHHEEHRLLLANLHQPCQD